MPHQNPWRRLQSRIVYENPWMRIREDDVLRPDGQPGLYGVVETRAATGVIALTPQEEVYVVGQYRYPMDTYSWEIIEGGADPGEDPLTACRRELREEAGLVAGHWEPLGGELHLSNCISSERGYLYVARDLTAVEANPEPTEQLEVRVVPFGELLRWVDEGKVTDAMTIIAVLRYARLCGKISGRTHNGAEYAFEAGI